VTARVMGVVVWAEGSGGFGGAGWGRGGRGWWSGGGWSWQRGCPTCVGAVEGLQEDGEGVDFGWAMGEDAGCATVWGIIGELVVGADDNGTWYTQRPEIAVFGVTGAEAEPLAD